MSKRKIPNWIVVDSKTNSMTCQQCGESRPIHLPALINDFIGQAEAFAQSHLHPGEPDRRKTT